MNTKRKLNCYLYSNLIVCFLSLNFIVNSKPTTLVAATKDKGAFNNLYKAAEVLDYSEDVEVSELVAPSTTETKTPATTKINVGVKTVTSKKTISYIKPSYDSVTGSNLVAYAKHYLGLRYVSAGRSLKTGTDCSGFTMLIYREFGINLGPTVSSQIYSGKYVSKADLKPGDLVFYGNNSRKASHVGIYMGNGQVIHQSNPRNGVKISSVNMMVYITARRVIFEKPKPKEEVKKEEVVKPNVVPEETTKPESNQPDVNNEEVTPNKPAVEPNPPITDNKDQSTDTEEKEPETPPITEETEEKKDETLTNPSLNENQEDSSQNSDSKTGESNQDIPSND